MFGVSDFDVQPELASVYVPPPVMTDKPETAPEQVSASVDVPPLVTTNEPETTLEHV